MVVGSYHPEVTGGGLQCRTLIQALQPRVGFTVLATTRDTALPAFEEVDGVPVHRVHVDLAGRWGWLRALARLVHLFLRLRPRFDIVHLHGFTRKSIPLVWLARLTGKRTIYKMTSLDADDAVAVAGDWLARRTLGAIDQIISVSPALTERYRVAGLPPSRLAVIPNGVDLARFRPAAPGDRSRLRQTLGLPPHAFVITFVGFFSRDKAPDCLVEAWCRLREGGEPSLVLVLIGATDLRAVEVDGELVAEVKARVRAAGAERDVHFVERTHDVPGWLRASDVFVLPSRREGLPNALLEAMACGVPCVVSRLPGVTDAVIDDGVNGLLVPAGDPGALEGALRQLLGDPAAALELGRRGRQTVVQNYSIAQTASRTLELYASLAGPL